MRRKDEAVRTVLAFGCVERVQRYEAGKVTRQDGTSYDREARTALTLGCGGGALEIGAPPMCDLVVGELVCLEVRARVVNHRTYFDLVELVEADRWRELTLFGFPELVRNGQAAAVPAKV